MYAYINLHVNVMRIHYRAVIYNAYYCIHVHNCTNYVCGTIRTHVLQYVTTYVHVCSVQ